MESTNVSADRLLLSGSISAKIYPKGCKYDRMAYRKLIFLGISCRKKKSINCELLLQSARTVETLQGLWKQHSIPPALEAERGSSVPARRETFPPPPLPSCDILAGF